MGPGNLEAWATRVLREQVGLGAAFLTCRKHGVAAQRARDLAEEAVQHALTQASDLTDFADHFTDFDHFCSWVRRVAVNAVVTMYRREQRLRSLEDGDTWPVVAPNEVVADVREFLAELSAEERDLLMRPYEEDLTLDDLVQQHLPPDERSANARRLDIWRRRRYILDRFRAWLLRHGELGEAE